MKRRNFLKGLIGMAGVAFGASANAVKAIEKPVIDWITPDTDVYGRSPVASALPDPKTLKEMQKAILDASIHGTGVMKDNKHVPLRAMFGEWRAFEDGVEIPIESICDNGVITLSKSIRNLTIQSPYMRGSK